jgi:hypothetical protein
LGIQRITPGPDGRPVVTRVKLSPRPPAAVQGLSLEQGRLVVTDAGNGRRDDCLRTVAATGTPEFSERSAFTGRSVPIANCPVQDAGCSFVQGAANGRIAWVQRGGAPDSFGVSRCPPGYFPASGPYHWRGCPVTAAMQSKSRSRWRRVSPWSSAVAATTRSTGPALRC